MSIYATHNPSGQATHSTELARLLPMWPDEIADQSIDGCRRRIALLRRALRAERRRGLAGHWTYDLSRHAALLACYRAEVTALDTRLEGQASIPRTAPEHEAPATAALQLTSRGAYRAPSA